MYIKGGKSQISDKATRVDVLDPDAFSNAIELITMARCAGM